jgi:ferric-dicitrate binding protein FerR (iron transport regulator)
VKNVELFNAYLNSELSENQQDELKKILSTDAGSEEFVRFAAESHSMCEILEQRMTVKEVKEVKGLKKPALAFSVAIAAFIALAFIVFSVVAPDQDSSVIVTRTQVPQKVIEAKIPRKVVLVDGSNVEVSAGGHLQIYGRDKISLKNGEYHFDVVDRSESKPLKILLSQGFLEIIGTKFSVRDSSESSSVYVREGKVRFTQNNQTVVLTAGKYAIAHKTKLEKYSPADFDELLLYLDGSLLDDFTFRDKSLSKNHGVMYHEIKQQQDELGAYMSMSGIGHARVKELDVKHKFTISIWVRFKDFITKYQAIAAKGDSSWRLTTYERTGHLHFALSGMEPEYLNSKMKLTKNKWYHVAAVFDGGLIQLYIDGKLDSQMSVQGDMERNVFPAEIGGNSEEHERNLQGDVDEVRIYNKPLSVSEIEALYHLGRSPSQ